MRKAIAAAVSTNELTKIRDRARQLHAAAKIAKDPGPLADLTEIIRRSERRLGELMELQAGQYGLNKGGKGMQKPYRVSGKPGKGTLAEAGIDKNLANRARKAAAMTERAFEADIADQRRYAE